MTADNVTLFKAIGAKLDYLNLRQSLVSQNIANADTPGYVPRDVTPLNFDAMLKGVRDQTTVSMAQPSGGGISLKPKGSITGGKVHNQRYVYEISPVGNAVDLEEQVMKSSRITADYTLMLNLYQKNIGLVKTAAGVQ